MCRCCWLPALTHFIHVPSLVHYACVFPQGQLLTVLGRPLMGSSFGRQHTTVPCMDAHADILALRGCQVSAIFRALVWLQVTDMRTQKEIATYRGHNRDVTCAAWHPLHEELFASGGYDGSLMYWLVSSPEPQVLLPVTAPHCL